MSEHEPESSGAESTPGEVDDDQLPQDLQPRVDNPLARHPDQTGDAEDAIGADTEGAADTAPLTREDAEYGHPGED